MGANNSSQSMSTTNEAISNTLMAVSNELETTFESMQESDIRFEMNMGNIVASGDCQFSLNATQNVDLDVQSVFHAQDNLSNQQRETFESDVINAQVAETNQQNKGLNLFQFNDADVQQDIQNTIENNSTSIIENSKKTSGITTRSDTIGMYIETGDITCSGGANMMLNLSQDVAISILTEQISETIIDVVQTSDYMAKVSNAQRSEITQANSGLDPMASLAASAMPLIISLVAGLGGITGIKKLFSRNKRPSAPRGRSSSMDPRDTGPAGFQPEYVPEYFQEGGWGRGPDEYLHRLPEDADADAVDAAEQTRRANEWFDENSSTAPQPPPRPPSGHPQSPGRAPQKKFDLTKVFKSKFFWFVFVVCLAVIIIDWYKVEFESKKWCPSSKQCSDNWEKAIVRGSGAEEIENCRFDRYVNPANVTEYLPSSSKSADWYPMPDADGGGPPGQCGHTIMSEPNIDKETREPVEESKPIDCRFQPVRCETECAWAHRLYKEGRYCEIPFLTKVFCGLPIHAIFTDGEYECYLPGETA